VKVGVRFAGSKSPKRGSLIALSQVSSLRLSQLYIITLHLFSLLPAARTVSDSSECAGQRPPDLSTALAMSGVLNLVLRDADFHQVRWWLGCSSSQMSTADPFNMVHLVPTVAAIAAIVGVVFFLAAIAVGVITKSVAIAVIPALAAAIVEVIAGLSLVLYRRATERLDVHSARLGDLQRLLVANSLVEAMTGSMRERARLELVLVVSGHNDPRNAGSRRQASRTKTRPRSTGRQATRHSEVTELTDLELDPDAQQTYD
jgi:hypothetical protein